MAGRPRKPTIVKINEGDAAKKGVNKLQQSLGSEPQNQRGDFIAPRGLNRFGKAEWSRLIRAIDRRALSLDNHGTLATAAIMWGRAEAENLEYENSVRLLTAQRAEAEKNPELEVTAKIDREAARESRDAFKLYLSAVSQLGATPATRSKVQLPNDKRDDLAELLSAPRTA